MLLTTKNKMTKQQLELMKEVFPNGFEEQDIPAVWRKDPVCTKCGEPVAYYIDNAICGECAGELE